MVSQLSCPQIASSVKKTKTKKCPAKGDKINPRNTSVETSLGNKCRVLVSEYLETETRAFRVPFLKNSNGFPKKKIFIF